MSEDRSSRPPDGDIEKYDTRIIIQKPIYDTNEYKYYAHHSGVKVFLVKSASTQTAAVALSVRVGFFFDTAKYLGLAHLMEHIILRGPRSQGKLLKLVLENGGNPNAYTESTYTTYYFDILHDKALEAFKLLMHFFEQPHTEEESVLRELFSVDEEFQGFKMDPQTRISETVTFMADASTPYHGMNVGNLKVLGVPEITLILRHFMHKYYVAPLIELVVFGQSSFANPAVINPFLAPLPAGPAPDVSLGDKPPLRKNDLNKRVSIAGLQGAPSLVFFFLLPLNIHTTPSNPLIFLKKLFETPEEGGLLWELEQRDIIARFSLTETILGNSYTYLYINTMMAATDHCHYNEIIFLFFEYLKFIRDNIDKRFYDEVHNVQRIKEEFEGGEEPLRKVVNIIKNSQAGFKPEKVLVGPTEGAEYNAANLKEVLQHLTPESSLVFCAAPEDEDLDEEVPHYEIKFKRSPLKIPTKYVKPQSFSIPISSFKPISFEELKKRNAQINASPPPPQKVPQDITPEKYAKMAKFFYVPLSDYLLPLFAATFFINWDASLLDGAQGRAFQALYCQLLSNKLHSLKRQLETINVSLEVSLNSLGITIELQGVSLASERAFTALHAALKKFYAEPTSQQEFDIGYKKAEQHILSESGGNPAQYIEKARQWILVKSEPTAHEVYVALKAVSFASLSGHLNSAHKKIYLQAIISGDLTSTEAQTYLCRLADVLLPETSEGFTPKELRPIDLKKPCGLVLPLASQGTQSSFLALYYYLGADLAACAFGAILASALTYRFYEELRAKKQLGYMVYMQTHRERGHSFAGFFIQSSLYDSAHCLKEVFNFISGEGRRLDGLKKSDYEGYQGGARQKYGQPPINFYKKHRELQQQIIELQKDFDWTDKILSEINKIDFSAYKKMFSEHLAVSLKYVHIHIESSDRFLEVQTELERIYSATEKIYTSLSDFHEDNGSLEDLWKTKI